MPEPRTADKPAPDQNDPTGHARPGSPTYHPGGPPSNNQKPSAGPVRKSSDDPEDAEHPKTGALESPPGAEPNVSGPMVQEGAPD